MVAGEKVRIEPRELRYLGQGQYSPQLWWYLQLWTLETIVSVDSGRCGGVLRVNAVAL